MAQTTHVCTAQLPAFPALDSRPAAIQPVPGSVGRLIVRNVLVVVPVRTPPPPIARLPAGQFCCSLFGLVLLDAPLPEISCTPLAPGGPCGPCGPAGPVGPWGPRGIWSGAKSTARSEWFLTFAEFTALFFSWTLPTLLRGSAEETAYAAPLSEIASARHATTIAGEGGRNRICASDSRLGPRPRTPVLAMRMRGLEPPRGSPGSGGTWTDVA